MERQQRRRDPSKNLVECVIGDVRYAVPIVTVREIVNPLPLVELPSAPAAVVGVADYRDEVVPVIDLRARFGMPPAPVTRRTKWVILRRSSRSFAIIVDGVTEVFRSTDVRPPPLGGPGADVRGIEGVTTHDGAMVFVLDVGRFGDLVAPVAAAELEEQP
jgi:purine-binding chemotaxis protein CheW